MTLKFTKLKTVFILACAVVFTCNDLFGQTGTSVTFNGGSCTGGQDVSINYSTSNTGSPVRNIYSDGFYKLEWGTSSWILSKTVLVAGPPIFPGGPPSFVPQLTIIATSSVASAPMPTSLVGSNWTAQSGCNLSKLEGTGTQSAGVMPVTLVSFEGITTSNAINLLWQTASEINNSHFDIERSTDGINFTSIDKVNGNGTTELEKAYTTQDNSPRAGINYYRLKQVDYDGQSSYSDIISVSYDSHELFSASIYPNPALSEININVKEETKVVISDMFGRIVKNTMLDANKNSISLADLISGIYTVTIGNQTGIKLVKE